ncbi:MAG: trehalase [Flavobacteriaceae bacterium]|nr:trehalase [Flavobacteriaceae bacterium]
MFFVISCDSSDHEDSLLRSNYVLETVNTLDYLGTPTHPKDRNMLMFSDQGAWFAYSLPKVKSLGFSGPFLMTQQNGVWASDILSELQLIEHGKPVVFSSHKRDGFLSHLEQTLANDHLKVTQQLFFTSGHTAVLNTYITNISEAKIVLRSNWKGMLFPNLGLKITREASNELSIRSSKSQAVGHLVFDKETTLFVNDSSYISQGDNFTLLPNEQKELRLSQTFIFPEYDWEQEKRKLNPLKFSGNITDRIEDKEIQLARLFSYKKEQLTDSIYQIPLAKSVFTLQNNWRIAAGELKFEGLFPSYHYKWFHGFWAWDSWKHAAGLAKYNSELAKNQMRTMFEYQSENGFVVDCIFRDTSIEKHNYRDTKPPLAAWAVSKIIQEDDAVDFIKEMYPKLKLYHSWWYKNRDYDQDGLCEYGATDGTLVAAKWESGMDNAVRFDTSKILKTSEDAYSLNQESVDLNAYLYAEKLYLSELALKIGLKDDSDHYLKEATILKLKIQSQFYDEEDGWFYDTSLDGKTKIKVKGCEGWLPLWANAATATQASRVKEVMMDPAEFFTKVPFQTLSASDPKFNPMEGYWRGPNWLDQSYFGIVGLQNYGFDKEAQKATVQLLKGAAGILEKGPSIRENYHPISGEGLNAQNFSWSAAHVLMLLTDDKQ